jgi:hypothetical protein
MHVYDQIKAASVDGKRPLVLFSGGWDSTLLLHHLLEFTNVDTFFVRANAHPYKRRKEKEARWKIKDWLNRDRLADSDRPDDQRFYVDEDYAFTLDEVWAQTRNYAMVQPISWLSAALIKFDPARHSGVAIGYLLGDQAPAFREHLEGYWKHGWALLRGMFEPAPPLWFPLLDRGITKEVVVRDLPMPLAKLAWACETPKSLKGTTRYEFDDDDNEALDRIIPCGKCKPCRLLAHTIADWEADHNGDDYWATRDAILKDTSQMELDFYVPREEFVEEIRKKVLDARPKTEEAANVD